MTVLFPWAAPTFFSITDSNTSSASTPFMAFTKDFLINMGSVYHSATIISSQPERLTSRQSLTPMSKSSVYPDFLSSEYPSQSVGIRRQITR